MLCALLFSSFPLLKKKNASCVSSERQSCMTYLFFSAVLQSVAPLAGHASACKPRAEYTRLDLREGKMNRGSMSPERPCASLPTHERLYQVTQKVFRHASEQSNRLCCEVPGVHFVGTGLVYDLCAFMTCGHHPAKALRAPQATVTSRPSNTTHIAAAQYAARWEANRAEQAEAAAEVRRLAGAAALGYADCLPAKRLERRAACPPTMAR